MVAGGNYYQGIHQGFSMSRCRGFTKNWNRCGRHGDWKFFCDEHRKQPIYILFFLIFTVGGGSASIYQCVKSETQIDVSGIFQNETNGNIINIDNNNDESANSKKPKGLYEYFDNDFPEYIVANMNIPIRIFNKDNKADYIDYKIRHRVVMDYESHSKFLSVYIPVNSHPNSSEICLVIGKYSTKILNHIAKKGSLIASRFDDPPIDESELTFSRKIYFYHEAHITSNEITRISFLLNKINILPVFRGTRYMSTRLHNKN